MKSLISRVACLWLVISLAANHATTAQNTEQTFALANQLFANHDYDAAILQYQRVIYFSESDSILIPAYSILADYWVGRDSFIRSNDYLQLAYFSAADTKLKNEFIIRRTENFIFQRQYLEALEELLTINPNDEATFKTVIFYEAIIQFGLGHYDKSENLFITFIDSVQHPALTKDVHKLFDRNERLNHINPKTAMIFSMIIPGSGQIYMGDYRNGINSLLLTGLFAWLFVNTTINSSLVDGITSVLPWYYRYYSGGYQRAEAIAKQQIAKRRAEIYQQLLTTLPAD